MKTRILTLIVAVVAMFSLGIGSAAAATPTELCQAEPGAGWSGVMRGDNLICYRIR